MWRKNRAVFLNSTCMGVDINRNFGFMWTAGAPCHTTMHSCSTNFVPDRTSDPLCDASYSGSGPFRFAISSTAITDSREAFCSEPESRALRDFFNSVPTVPVASLSMHSYGQNIYFPFGYSKAIRPQNWMESVRNQNRPIGPFIFFFFFLVPGTTGPNGS